MLRGLPLQLEPHPFLRVRGVRLLLSLLDSNLRNRQSNISIRLAEDASFRGLGSSIWFQGKVSCVGVSQTAFSSAFALEILQSWRLKSATRTRRGRSSLAFTFRLLKRFFQHLCGRSPYANLRECLTALSHAQRSRASLTRSMKHVLGNSEL